MSRPALLRDTRAVDPVFRVEVSRLIDCLNAALDDRRLSPETRATLREARRLAELIDRDNGPIAWRRVWS